MGKAKQPRMKCFHDSRFHVGLKLPAIAGVTCSGLKARLPPAGAINLKTPSFKNLKKAFFALYLEGSVPVHYFKNAQWAGQTPLARFSLAESSFYLLQTTGAPRGFQVVRVILAVLGTGFSGRSGGRGPVRFSGGPGRYWGWG